MMIIPQIIKQIILFLIKFIIIALALWIVGRSTVGKKKAKFSDALWITFLGLIIGGLIARFIPFLGFIGSFIVLLLWLGLIHHFFDTGWLGALGIAIVALIVYVVLSWVVSFILKFPFWNLFMFYFK